MCWACHRRCKHCYEGRFRPYVRDELAAVIAEAERNTPLVLGNLPERMTYLDLNDPAPDGTPREKPGRIILSGGESLLEGVRQRVTYPVIEGLVARYAGNGGVKVVVQTTGDLLTPAIVGDLLARGVWMISVAGMDDFHVGMEGEAKQAAAKAKLSAMMQAQGMTASGLTAADRKWLDEPGPLFSFFGATPDSWIGKLWPRGRSWENGLSTATLADNFCNRWSGGLNFLHHRHSGSDFTVPVEGLAAPWRMAQIVFIHDTARLPAPPRTMRAMADWAAGHRGRLAHPTVRNFLGATFLKQALYELTPDPKALQQPADDAAFAPSTAAMWVWYDTLRPNLWRGGRQFPENGPATRNLLNDGEIDLMVSFNPAEAANAIATGLLPPTVRGYVLDGGTIGNASFVAIPANAAAPGAAQVVANFLLSPAAQAHASDPDSMGNVTVLDLARLSAADRKLFDDVPRGLGTIPAAELGQPLAEPHPSWMTRITAEWERRTSAG